MGFVSLGGSYAEPSDPEVARVSKIIRNSMTRLHAEITRSISFYRSQQGGSQPQHVYLCGGSVSLPYIREFFAEKLQMPIDFFNPLRNVTVGSGVDIDAAGRNAHTLGELVGLAIRSACEAPMELNLEPASVTKAKLLARKQPFMILAGLCFLLSLAGSWLYFLRATQVERQVINTLTPQVAALKNLADRFDSTEKDIVAARAIAAPFVTAAQERDYWVRVIDDINARLPQAIHLGHQIRGGRHVGGQGHRRRRPAADGAGRPAGGSGSANVLRAATARTLPDGETLAGG